MAQTATSGYNRRLLNGLESRWDRIAGFTEDKMNAGIRGNTVESEIFYLADPPSSDPSRRLQYYITATSQTNMRLAPAIVQLTDARPSAQQCDLDVQGFRLVKHKSAVTDYRNTEQLYGQMDEIAALIREVTGASDTLCLGPALPRFGETDPQGEQHFNARPARFVHADFTDESLRGTFQYWEGVRLEDYSRFAAYNVWRVITPPPQDVPLAVCDARTVAAKDPLDALAVMDPPGGSEFHNVTTAYFPNPAHRWYYFKDMTPEEVLIFKAHDSDAARAHRVPHTAFTDPTCPKGVPARASAEIRVLAVFK
jgi:hypothetical protein